MKAKLWFPLTFLGVFLFLMFTFNGFAQTSPITRDTVALNQGPPIPTTTYFPVVFTSDSTQLTILLAQLLGKYPVLSAIIAFLGSMRVWAKPTFSLLHQLVDATPALGGSKLWAKVYNCLTLTPLGQFLSFLLDWLTSIKLIPPGDAPVVPLSPEPETTK